MSHPVVHFEVSGNDLGKLQEFYGELFGWKTEKVEGDMPSADRTAHLGETINAFCNPPTLGEFNGGVCANLSGAGLVDCLRNRVECRFCRMWNAIDNMAIDCSAWSGTTCP